MIRASCKTGNQRAAEQIEAARETQLAKGEVGIKDRKPTLTLATIIQREFWPFIDANFEAKPKTLSYHLNGLKRLLEFEKLAGAKPRARLGGAEANWSVIASLFHPRSRGVFRNNFAKGLKRVFQRRELGPLLFKQPSITS
jgi:hypothetical protein